MTDGVLDLGKLLHEFNKADPGQPAAWQHTLDEHLGRHMVPGGVLAAAPGRPTLTAIADSFSAADWPYRLQRLHAVWDASLCQGELGLATAVYQKFTLDVLDTAQREAGGELGALIARSAFMLMPDFLTGQFVAGLVRSGQREGLTCHPSEDVQRMVMHGLRDRVWGRIRLLSRAARHDSSSFEDWGRRLARLLVALQESHLANLVRIDDGALLTPEQLVEARREEAYAEEQFAHVFTAVEAGYVDRAAVTRLAEVGESASVWTREQALQAREQLRLMRARYQIPAYLFEKLDLAATKRPPHGTGR